MKLKFKLMSRLLTVTIGTLLVASAGKASAAGFKLETKVQGYSTYAVVRPELRSVLGGRVRWNVAQRCYETDRVMRGEPVRVTIFATNPGERCNNAAIAGISSSNGFSAYRAITLPFVESRFTVSKSPSFDNVVLSAVTSTGSYAVRLPIGSR
jgi:hypothetical protein